jgi:hypothetical protein
MHDLIALKKLYSKSVESNLIQIDAGRLAGPVFRELATERFINSSGAGETKDAEP